MIEKIINVQLFLLIIIVYSVVPLYSQNNDTLSYFLGKEIQVNEPNSGGDLQCEPSVAINKNIIIVSWNDSYGGKINSKTGSAVGWAISYNNGQNFNFGGYLPKIDEKSVLRVDGVDSWLGTDSNGNFYLQVLSWQDRSHYLFVYYMDGNNLGKWEKRYTVYSDKLIDKPSMNVTSTGQINISYTGNIDKKNEIYFIHSSNQGKSWQTPLKLSNSTNPVKTGSCVVSYNDKILVGWVEGSAMNQNEIWFAYSLDNGFSFSKAKLLYKISKTFNIVNGYTIGALKDKGGNALFLLSTSVWITYTLNNNQANFWLAYTEGTENEGSRVILFKMDENFKQISGPFYVGNNSTDYERIFPTMTSIRNLPAVFYYDRRNHPFTTLTDVYLSIKLENDTFQDIKINSTPTDWSKLPGDPKFAPTQRNIGDYMTIASYDNKLATTWVGEKNGKARIYFRLIEFR